MSNKRMYHYQRKEGVPYYYKSATEVSLIVTLSLVASKAYDKGGWVWAVASLICYPVVVFVIFMFVVFPFEWLTDFIFGYKEQP